MLLDSFRTLDERITEYKGDFLYRDVLEPIVPAARGLLSPLQRYRARVDPPTVVDEESWTLFALSVVNDHLLLPLRLSRDEYRWFFQALGFELFEGGSFHPIRHEIVEVGNWPNPTKGIELGRTYWPGLRFGTLVFSRSAVDVFCHSSFGIIEGVADRSTLFETQDRMRRKTDHLSHGWGSNSRWRTRFRLDYDEPAFAVFNLTGENDLADPVARPDDRYADRPHWQRRELLVNRCFVSADGAAGDWFPYGDTLAVRQSDPAWPLKEEAFVLRRDLPSAARKSAL